MAQTISLAAYSIRIREYHSDQYIPFDQFEETKDFKDFIEEYLKSTDVKLDNDAESQRMFRIDVKKTMFRNRILEGYIETGEYGYESVFIDQKGTQKFRRESGMAEMLPFYFSLWMPRNKTTGILIIQRFGSYGASDAFKKSLIKYLRSSQARVNIEISQVITAKAIKKILSSSAVRKITFRKYQMPTDYATYFDKGHLDENIGYAEVSLVAGRNHDLPVHKWVNKILGDKEIDYLVEEKIDPGKNKTRQEPPKRKENRKPIKSGAIGQNPDSIKVEFAIGNGSRTIDLHNLNIFRSYFDITEKVRLDANGHPNLKSLQKEVELLRLELKELLYPNQDVQ